MSNATWLAHGRNFLLRCWKSRVLRWSVSIVAALLVLAQLVSQFWLPGYLKTKLESTLSTTLHREVQVDAVKVAPHRLALRIEGLRIAGLPSGASAANDAPPLLAFEALDVNLSAASLFYRAPVVSSLRLVAPRAAIAREAEGRYSISDLVDEWSRPAPPAESGAQAAAPMRFAVNNIEIERGEIVFIDHPKASRHVVSELQLGVPFVANFASDQQIWVEPRLSARINGAPLELKGQVHPFTEQREATLALQLRDFDLTPINAYSPLKLPMRIASARLDSDLQLVFAQPPNASPNIAISGEATLRDLELQEAPADGKAGPRLMKLARAAVKIKRADQSGALEIESITIEVPQVEVRRSRAGKINWLALVPASPESAPAQASTQGSTQTPAPNGKAAPMHIGEATIVKGQVHFQDEAVKAPLKVEAIEVKATGIDLAGATPLHFAAAANVNAEGRAQADGDLAWAPLAAKLKIDLAKLDLVPLQGWATQYMAATLTHGFLSFAGDIAVASAAPAVNLRGKGRIAELRLLDAANASEILRWRGLDVEGLDVATAPLRINIAAVRWNDFFARLVLSPEGRLNLKDLSRGEEANETLATNAAAPEPPAKASPAPAPAASALPVRIGRIELERGNINFSDFFIKPNYRANLTDLKGRIGPLAAGSPGAVDIAGTVDHAAPVSIAGKLDPFGAELALDLEAHAKGIDMPTFSPYSGKYLGYVIQKGKLSVDLQYHIEHGELKAENNILLDQLTLGERIESPDALSIPVTLAIALLKNARGEIDLQLPISGSINDPQFRIGAIIVKVFVNLIVKAVTAPFALLGSLFGGGQDLSHVEFAPGLADLSDDATKRLEALGKALADRPGLRMDITGRASAAFDGESLRRLALEQRLRAAKLADQAKQGKAGGALSDVSITPEERGKYLEQLLRAELAPSAKAEPKAKPPSAAEMETALLSTMPLGENELIELASRRAGLVREWLLERGQVAAERVFVLAPAVASASDTAAAGRVDFALK